MGTPRRRDSASAMSSFLMSMMRIASGSRSMSTMPAKAVLSLLYSRLKRERSFLEMPAWLSSSESSSLSSV